MNGVLGGVFFFCFSGGGWRGVREEGGGEARGQEAGGRRMDR